MDDTKWPVRVNSFSDILSERLVAFILSGASESEKIPLSLVENTSDGLKRYNTFNPRQNSNPFCVCFRGDPYDDSRLFPWAEEYCWECEKGIVAKLLEDEQKIECIAIPYKCHMKFNKLAAIITVGNLKGVLLTGQHICSEEERVDIEKEIDSLGKGERKGIEISTEECEKLKCHLNNNIVRHDNKEKFEFSAHEVQGALRDYLRKAKNTSENLLYRDLLSNLDVFINGNTTNFWVQMNLFLDYLVNRLNVQYAALFATDRILKFESLANKENILYLKSFSNLPKSVISSPPHFNWRKSKIDIRDINSMLLKSAMEENISKGLKAKNSKYFENYSIVFPFSKKIGIRNLLILGPFQENISIEEERPFLLEILNAIGFKLLNKQFNMYFEWKEKEAIKKTAFLAHQVRSRIQSIYGFQSISIGYSKGIKSEEQFDSANRIFTAIAADLASVTSHIQKFDRMLFDTSSLNKEDINIESVIESSIEDQLLYANEKNITINCNIDEELPLLKADPFWIRMLLNQLINNAIKYSPNSDINNPYYINISVQVINNDFQFKITNIGKGIKEENYRDIFERGVRILPDGKVRFYKRSGMGMGLWEARQIVIAHKGEIIVNSTTRARTVVKDTSLNCINTFVVTIPIET